MSNDIRNIIPGNIQDFKIVLENYQGNRFDVTQMVTELSMFESIYDHFISGDLVLIDNAAMFSFLPILGQEKIEVSYKYKEVEIEKQFTVIGVKEISHIVENSVGGYVLKFSSNKHILNEINTFSKSFSGRNTDIISQIYKSYLSESNADELEIISDGGSSHNIVFPYVKPYAAIDLVLKNTFAEDKTPLFLFESVNYNKTKMISLGDLFNQEEIKDIRNIIQTNSDNIGTAVATIPDSNQNMHSFMINDAYDTVKYISNGSLSSDVDTVDLSNKTYSNQVFDYVKHTPVLNPGLQDFISTKFKINEKNLNQIGNSKKTIFYNANLEYSNLGSLNTVDSINKLSMLSYYKRSRTNVISMTTDSIKNLNSGDLVNLKLAHFAPKLDEDNSVDKVNSGVYLVSAIRHYIKNLNYTMVVEVIRNGINKEVEL